MRISAVGPYLLTTAAASQSLSESILIIFFDMSKPEMTDTVASSKLDVETTESIHKPTNPAGGKGRDKAAALLASNERIVVTSAENKQVLRKIDLVILPILLSVYFLQSLDKTTLSYASIFGLIEDANLDPNSQQYSWLGSIVYIAQLVAQPLVAVLLVKLRMGKFMGVMVFTWGCILCGMAGAHNFGGLMATRFLLGAFEAAVGNSRPRAVSMQHANALQLPLSLLSFKCGTSAASRRTETQPGTPCWASSTSSAVYSVMVSATSSRIFYTHTRSSSSSVVSSQS